MAIKIVKVSEKEVEKKVKDVLFSLINREGENKFSIETLAKMIIKVVLEGKTTDEAWFETATEIKDESLSVIVKREDYDYGIIISEIGTTRKKDYIIEKVKKREKKEEEDVWS